MYPLKYIIFFLIHWDCAKIETYKVSVVEYNKSHVTNGSFNAVKSDAFIDSQDKDDSADDNRQDNSGVFHHSGSDKYKKKMPNL